MGAVYFFDMHDYVNLLFLEFIDLTRLAATDLVE